MITLNCSSTHKIDQHFKWLGFSVEFIWFLFNLSFSISKYEQSREKSKMFIFWQMNMKGNYYILTDKTIWTGLSLLCPLVEQWWFQPFWVKSRPSRIAHLESVLTEWPWQISSCCDGFRGGSHGLIEPPKSKQKCIKHVDFGQSGSIFVKKCHNRTR